ncbi:MAG: hypothetical protein IT428_12245 [Planctomycetaceae bacterium]|nr:hypothetical protein [Planctomycetaceae bacterium]
MLVTIHNHAAGTCAWCRCRSDDGVQAQFKDGLSGFFCKKDFWAALKARADEQASPVEASPKVARSSQS